MNGTVRYWRNLGGGRFDLPRPMRDAPAGLTLADPEVQLVDADGDGRIDLLVNKDGLSGYFPLRFNGEWDRRSFRRQRVAPSFSLADPEVKLVDLNGDGVTDVIRSGSRLECFFNDPQEGWNGARWAERRALQDFPNINFSDPRIKWGDMSGDGLQDMVLVHDGNVEYWPNLGHGNWGKRVHMHDNPRFPYGYDPKRILIGDVNGDGLADLAYVDHCRVLLWINQSGNGWSDPIEIDGTPPVTDMDAVRLDDMLGTGVGGVLWSSGADGLARDRMFFLDFTGGVKPYLLNEMDNHTGAVTRVAYAPSTQFYLADARQLETRWETPLPFPVQVVARVEVIDAISGGKLTTEYSYHHGYWDGAEREFRGFGRVDQRDTELFEGFNAAGLHGEQPFNAVEPHMYSPPTETRTWFHQGPIGDEYGEWAESDFSAEYWTGDADALDRPQAMTDFLNGLPRRVKRDALRTLRGRVLRGELYALDGSQRQDRPYTVSEFLYGVREEAAPGSGEEDRPHIFFSYSLAERTTQWERGDDPMTAFTFNDDYDAYGQPRTQISIAVPRRSDYLAAAAPGDPYLATHTVTSYAQRDDAERYMVDRVAGTTSWEIVNDGGAAVFELVESIRAGGAEHVIIGQALNYYDGPAFQGLPFGQLGDYGALVRTESLVLTEEILHEAYRSGDAVLEPPEVPPYLVPGQPPAWTSDYPQEFRDQLPELAGYTFHAGGAQHERGYFTTIGRRRYDFQDDPGGQGHGLLTATRDPLGRDTTIAYDGYDFLPTQVTDPAGLMTQASYDYRVLQPREVTGPNGNRSAYTFTPLGLLAGTAIMGKTGEDVGDTLETPGTRLEYDFLAYAEDGQPISVRTIQRVHHVHDTDVPSPEREETIESVEYSDGFGRLLQTRTQAEDETFGDPVFGQAVLPADQSDAAGTLAPVVGQPRDPGDPPNVVVSGWQIYDNKGRVVEKYEPFFASGWDHIPPVEAQLGQKVTQFYDPRGQVIRAVNPDGSEGRVIYGVPADLADPEDFAPTPWELYSYDANDNAGRSHPADSAGFQNHWNTPSSAVVDALGRTVESVERNGPDPAADWYTTRSSYDIRGNLLTVTDALGRLAFQHVYDLADNPLRIENIDAGVRRTVLDAAGNTVEGRDSKGALVLSAYDDLNRPVRLWARDGGGQPRTLRERLVYGDRPDSGLTDSQAKAANLLGRLYQHYDEAGRLTFEAYDFKGNLLEKARQVISDDAILVVFDPPPPDWRVEVFRVDWEPPAGTTLSEHTAALLDSIEYRTSTTYDALNRVKTMRYPEDVDGTRKELRPRYNRAGALERVELGGETYVDHIAYNAKGQRTLVAYGNQIMTRYAYGPHTFRLARLHSERYTTPASLTYAPTGPPLQDFAYDYDLAGNITAIHNRTPESGILDTPLGFDALDRAFTYDPIYRLLSATGRECDRPPEQPWDSGPRPADLTRTRAYTEQYQYDPVGNMVELRHMSNGGGFTRQFTLVPGNNRLSAVTIGDTVYNYNYDTNGNMTGETRSRHFEWDHADRMKAFRVQAGGAEPSIYAHYLYDAGGQRVKKLVRKQGGRVEVTVYVDGLLEHQYVVQGNSTQENNTLHVMDDQQRIATVSVGAPFPGDRSQAVKYHLGDHLGSSNLVVDDAGSWTDREEHTPYGETSFGGYARKCYRFTGKERDEESGFYYHGARYYAPWFAKWVSCDPAGIVDSVNLYVFALDNPTCFQDPTGFSSEESSIWPTWGEVKEGVYKARKWVGKAGDVAGTTVFEGMRTAGDFLGIPSSVTNYASTAGATYIETVIHVWGGFLMVGPNIVVDTAEVPDKLGHGMYEIRRGLKSKSWEPVLEGTGKILEATGTVASTGLMAESVVRAAEARTAVSAAKGPAPSGTKATVETKTSTGPSPGTAYIRKLKDTRTGDILSKTTTVVSKEGVVVRRHADFYGKKFTDKFGPDTKTTRTGVRKGLGVKDEVYKRGEGLRKGRGDIPSGPTFPAAWTGIKDIPGATAPHGARSIVIHSYSAKALVTFD